MKTMQEQFPITSDRVAERKVAVLCQQIRELALTEGPRTRLPSVRDLCLRFTASRTSIHAALNILETQNILYRKAKSGIFVSPTLGQKHICVLFHTQNVLAAGASPFWGMLWARFAEMARQRAHPRHERHSFHLIVESSPEDPVLPLDVIEMIQEGRVHGVLGIGLSYSALHWLYEHAIPCVSFAGAWSSSAYLIGLDPIALLSMGVARLVEQGCRHIGLWLLNHFLSLGEGSRYLSNFLAEHDIKFDPALVQSELSVIRTTEPAPSNQELGYLLAHHVFASSLPKPDGLIITDDMVTDGALAGFFALGVRPGDSDLKIVTHGNTGSMLFFSLVEGVTVYEFDPAEIVQQMFNLLDLLLNGQRPAEHVIKLTPRLRPPIN